MSCASPPCCCFSASSPCLRAAQPERLVARFDFEETNDAGVKLGSGLTLPRLWAPIGRSPGTGDPLFERVPAHREWIRRGGFPLHNPVGFAADRTDPGGYTLRLGITGGDVGAYLAAGAVPAAPGGAYRVDLSLRRSGLSSATPRVQAFFLDSRGRRMPSTATEAADVAPADANGWERWTLRLEAPGGPAADAASIGLEVGLRQARPDPADPLGAQRILPVQASGALEIDEVEVWRLPIAELTTGRPLEVVRLPERPTLRLRMRDLDGEALTAAVVVRDLDGRVVDRVRRAVDASSGEDLLWRPTLPRLGWYEAVAEVRAPAGEALVHRRLPFVHAPAMGLRGSGGDGAGAGGGVMLDLTSLPLPVETLSEAALAVDLPAVLLPGWSPGLELGDVPAGAAALGAAARTLSRRLVRLEVALGPEPAALSATSPAEGPALAGPASSWLPWAEPLVVAVGGRAAGWWVGAPAEAGAPPPPNPALQRLVRDWAAGSRVRRVAAADHAGWPVEAGDAAVAPAGSGAVSAIDGSFRVVSSAVPSGLSRRGAAERFANALLDAHVAAPGVRPVAGPLLHDDGGVLTPGPLLPVAERLTVWLAGGPAQPWAVSDSIEAWVLPGGVLLARSRGGPEARLDLGATDSVEAEDIFGNRWRPASAGASAGDGHVSLRVGRAPIRVRGLDPADLALAASFAVDRPLLAAVPGPQPRTVTLFNGGGSSVRGTLRLEAPDGWTVSPARLPFTLAAGERAALPVVFSIPANAAGGPARLRAIASLGGDAGGARDVRLAAPLELGLPGLRLQAGLGVSGEGDADLTATCVVFNEGTEAASLSVYAQAAGQPYRERLAPRVEPGGVVVFRFRFPGAAASGTSTPVLCGVRRSGQAGALNAHLTLE